MILLFLVAITSVDNAEEIRHKILDQGEMFNEILWLFNRFTTDYITSTDLINLSTGFTLKKFSALDIVNELENVVIEKKKNFSMNSSINNFISAFSLEKTIEKLIAINKKVIPMDDNQINFWLHRALQNNLPTSNYLYSKIIKIVNGEISLSSLIDIIFSGGWMSVASIYEMPLYKVCKRYNIKIDLMERLINDFNIIIEDRLNLHWLMDLIRDSIEILQSIPEVKFNPETIKELKIIAHGFIRTLLGEELDQNDPFRDYLQVMEYCIKGWRFQSDDAVRRYGSRMQNSRNEYYKAIDRLRQFKIALEEGTKLDHQLKESGKEPKKKRGFKSAISEIAQDILGGLLSGHSLMPSEESNILNSINLDDLNPEKEEKQETEIEKQKRQRGPISLDNITREIALDYFEYDGLSSTAHYSPHALHGMINETKRIIRNIKMKIIEENEALSIEMTARFLNEFTHKDRVPPLTRILRNYVITHQGDFIKNVTESLVNNRPLFFFLGQFASDFPAHLLERISSTLADIAALNECTEAPFNLFYYSYYQVEPESRVDRHIFDILSAFSSSFNFLKNSFVITRRANQFDLLLNDLRDIFGLTMKDIFGNMKLTYFRNFVINGQKTIDKLFVQYNMNYTMKDLLDCLTVVERELKPFAHQGNPNLESFVDKLEDFNEWLEANIYNVTVPKLINWFSNDPEKALSKGRQAIQPKVTLNQFISSLSDGVLEIGWCLQALRDTGIPSLVNIAEYTMERKGPLTGLMITIANYLYNVFVVVKGGAAGTKDVFLSEVLFGAHRAVSKRSDLKVGEVLVELVGTDLFNQLKDSLRHFIQMYL